MAGVGRRHRDCGRRLRAECQRLLFELVWASVKAPPAYHLWVPGSDRNLAVDLRRSERGVRANLRLRCGVSFQVLLAEEMLGDGGRPGPPGDDRDALDDAGRGVGPGS